MNQKILHTPEGLRDIYGDECARKQELERRLHAVLASYGYRDIETPAIEFFEVFGSDIGTIPSKDLYKFFDREGNTLALRPDFTPSIARAASRYFTDTDRPVRLSYLGRTYINRQGLQGRLHESTQLGAELIGEASVDADAEIIAMATQALAASGLSDFQISIGHVAFYESLVEEAGLDRETAERLRVLIHNHNTFGVEKLLSDRNIDGRIGSILTDLPRLNGGEEVLKTAGERSEGLRAHAAIARLKELLEILKVYGVEQHVSFDFGMLSQYMYYTGIIFRGYTYGTGDAVVKGGRYDSLLAHFGKDAPSVGFVISVGDLMNALLRQKAGDFSGTERTLVLCGEEKRLEGHRLAAALRAEGKCVELVIGPDAEKGYAEDETEYTGVIRL